MTTRGDRPNAATASYTVLYTGYGSPNVAATVGYIQDGERRGGDRPGDGSASLGHPGPAC